VILGIFKKKGRLILLVVTPLDAVLNQPPAAVKPFFETALMEVSEKLDNFSDTGINPAISWFFEKNMKLRRLFRK
jgi:hypothetical protein